MSQYTSVYHGMKLCAKHIQFMENLPAGMGWHGVEGAYMGMSWYVYGLAWAWVWASVDWRGHGLARV